MSPWAASDRARDSHRGQYDDADAASGHRGELAAIEALAEPDSRLLIAHDPYDPHCEKIRALRTELLLRRESTEQADIVALVSPCAGEGRSQLAAELAISFAQLGRPTLLVDADLRRPQQHLLFGIDNRKGLSQAIEFAEKPYYHNVRNLPRMSLLTAGGVPTNPLELLLSGNFPPLIEDWRDNFEFVVVDTAPVTHFSDALAVASLVGRVLALSRAQHTPYKESQEMMRRLAATRSQVLGAVISHF